MPAGRTIAVAGGTGFIGRHVVAGLLDAGWQVVVLARGRRALPPELAERVELRPCDLAAGLDPALLEGCAAIVNLVGIKRPTPALSFEAAHVEVPRHIAEAAEAAGVTRLIHVSVAGARRDPDSAYLDSKARGEAELRGREGLELTILRPGVVHGAGDDLIRNLADPIRAAPIFPAPDGGRAELQPVAVEDVAEAVRRCLERPASVGACLDLVGPERLAMRELIARVSAAPSVDRRCLILPAPTALLRPAAAVLERISADPLITPSQLGLLSRGVVGDPEPARELLGLEPRRLDDAGIAAALVDFEPRLPSVRLVPDPRAGAALEQLCGDAPGLRLRLAAFAVIAVATLLLGPNFIESIWLRMTALELVLSVLALLLIPLDWRALLRPSKAALAWGLGAGVVMWAGALGLGAALARLAPELWAESASIYAWALDLELAPAIALLVVVVTGEELVWRGALGLALNRELGPWPAVAVSAVLYSLAHLSTGPPLLALAALLAGLAWGWLAIRTRSLLAPLISHLLWDASLLWLTPMT